MIGRTHDLAALTALNIAFLILPLMQMSLATAATAFFANFIGGLFPDIDQPTSDLWDNFRGGELISKYVCKLLGGHRNFSHSIVGVIAIGAVSAFTLQKLSTIVLIDMQIVWLCFMIGVLSHILADMPTKEGVPLFWPIMFKVGIPPFRFMRIRSGFFVEKLIVFPGLLALNAYLIYANYGKYIDLVHSLRK
ncbi:MAG: metal-dependent hydrolase [Candidatus Woesebacteria bacterium]